MYLFFSHIGFNISLCFAEYMLVLQSLIRAAVFRMKCVPSKKLSNRFLYTD